MRLAYRNLAQDKTRLALSLGGRGPGGNAHPAVDWIPSWYGSVSHPEPVVGQQQAGADS